MRAENVRWSSPTKLLFLIACRCHRIRIGLKNLSICFVLAKLREPDRAESCSGTHRTQDISSDNRVVGETHGDENEVCFDGISSPETPTTAKDWLLMLLL
jgi:hypothetical protein